MSVIEWLAALATALLVIERLWRGSRTYATQTWCEAQQKSIRDDVQERTRAITSNITERRMELDKELERIKLDFWKDLTTSRRDIEALEERQRQHELSTAELRPVIQGLQEAVRELTTWLRDRPQSPQCQIASDRPHDTGVYRFKDPSESDIRRKEFVDSQMKKWSSQQ